MKIHHADISALADYSRHLKNLSEADRYTRFCYNIKDEGIDQFILTMLYNADDHHLFTAEIADDRRPGIDPDPDRAAVGLGGADHFGHAIA